MKIQNGEILTLANGKEYVCISSIIENGKNYIYLMSNFKPLEIMFAEAKGEGEDITLELIESKEEKLRLLSLFTGQKQN